MVGMDAYFKKNLSDRKNNGLYRQLREFNNLTDFSSTASALHEMDVLVTVDSAIAHLGGALGISTWILLPFDPDWRWMLDRTDSPWYPNMTLYRQQETGHWEYVFEIMKKDLVSLIKKKIK